MTDSSSTDDLPRRLERGTASAKDEVYRRFQRGLVAHVQKKLGGPGKSLDPEDVAESAWGSFYSGIDKGRYEFDHSGAVWALLKEIAFHKLCDARRKDKKTPHPVDFQSDWPEDGVGTPADAAEGAGVLAASIIQEILQGLPAVYGTILLLWLDGCSQSQIAKQVGCGREAARFRINKLRERLEGVKQRLRRE